MADFLSWPFFEDRHRELYHDLKPFVAELDPIDDGDDRGSCRRIVKALGKAGWLEHATALNAGLDVRSLCLIRESLAYHHSLADFTFAMQGLGSAPVALYGSDALQAK